VAAAEMAFAGGLGMTIHLEGVPLGEHITRDDFILFAESNTRFLVEVAPANSLAFEKTMEGIDFALVGEVTNWETLDVYGMGGRRVLSASLAELKEAWQKPLRW